MKKRDSGIELLRCIAMLMVILIHCYLYGNYYNEAIAVGEITAEISTFLRLSFRPAVNIFILITGYFMSKSAFDLKKTYSRVFDTYQRLWFYSAILTVVFLLLGPEYCIPVDSTTSMQPVQVLLKGIFPLTSQMWYYLTNYIILCLLAPFINIVLQTINKKQHQALIIVLSLFLSLFMTLLKVYPFSLWLSDYTYSSVAEGKSVFSFIYIYIIGAYIGMYSKEREKPRFSYLAAAFGCVGINYLIISLLGNIIKYNNAAFYYSNPFVILQGVFMLLFFKDLHFHSRIINTLASTTLGVYAFHEFRFVRPVIWERMFNFENFDCSNILKNIVLTTAISIFIFIALGILDLGVQQLFKFKNKLFKLKS